jgi:hypothetical protein
MRAKHALSQLSYAPRMGQRGLEPLTSRLSSVCSNRMSYWPNSERQKASYFSSRKEVIQPQVLLQLPCYDLTPVIESSVVNCLLAVSLLVSGKLNSHGLTGGVYKAQGQIHRTLLICDYL